jgi:cell division control protein 45
MINCGGTVNLTEFLELPRNVQVHVMDSHRPYHLRNVAEQNSQVVLWDDAITKKHYPKESELYSDDDDEEEDEDDEERSPKRRRTSLSEKAERHVARAERNKKLSDYYRGSFYGTSAALLMYSLGQKLSKDDNDMLW